MKELENKSLRLFFYISVTGPATFNLINGSKSKQSVSRDPKNIRLILCFSLFKFDLTESNRTGV
jgi:hypothetical protein